MINKNNQYTIWEQEYEDGTKFYAIIEDADGVEHIVSLSEAVYLELQKSKKTKRNQQCSDERHKERFDLTDEAMYYRAFTKPESVEETVITNLCIEQLAQEMRNLPEPQKSRIYLYYIKKFTYDQIAKHEQKQTGKEKACSPRAVKYSIDIAIEKIKKYFNFFEN